MSMQGKIIAVTGGASGIGLATAKLLSSRGAVVCLADYDPEALFVASSYFRKLRAPFHVDQLDVTKRVAVDEWVEDIVGRHGKLDGAVNCAGVIGQKHGITKLTELEDEEWDRIIGVNLTGLMYSLRAELRKISDGGSIVNISSIQGVMGMLTSCYTIILNSYSSQMKTGFPGVQRIRPPSTP
jgi:NAD(P)-dependent dehydrogenase (short-subunit alcohol dehydrogenase family)